MTNNGSLTKNNWFSCGRNGIQHDTTYNGIQNQDLVLSQKLGDTSKT